MVPRTVERADYASYLSECHAGAAGDQEEAADREGRLARFPFPVMLKVSYPELDFANRWCWAQFGPGDGECLQRYSEYPACSEPAQHEHIGSWTSHWFEKTDYDFGFNEWYFESEAQQSAFIADLINLNWGEHYGPAAP